MSDLKRFIIAEACMLGAMAFTAVYWYKVGYVEGETNTLKMVNDELEDIIDDWGVTKIEKEEK